MTNRAGLAYQCLGCFFVFFCVRVCVHMFSEMTKKFEMWQKMELNHAVRLQWCNDDVCVHSQTRVITLPPLNFVYLLLCTPYFDNFSLDSARQYLAIQNKKDERKTNLTLGTQHSYPGHTHTLLAITFLIYIHIYREWKKKTQFVSFLSPYFFFKPLPAYYWAWLCCACHL